MTRGRIRGDEIESIEGKSGSYPVYKKEGKTSKGESVKDLIPGVGLSLRSLNDQYVDFEVVSGSARIKKVHGKRAP